MQFEIERGEGPPIARLSGLAMLEGWEQVLPRLGSETARDRYLVLVLHGLVGFLGIPERRRVGEFAALHLKHLQKVAFVVPPEKLSGTTAPAAASLGLTLSVFTSLDEARAWLAD